VYFEILVKLVLRLEVMDQIFLYILLEFLQVVRI